MAVFALLAAITLLDQVTKHVFWSRFRLGELRVVVPGLFNLRYIRNEGAAWGIFAGHRWPLVLVSAVMLAILWVHRRDILAYGRTGSWATGLLAGGILGNLLDRLRLGYVVDFLDFHWQEHHFPAFNVADSAICVGVLLYLAISLFQGTPRPAAETPPAA